jgi:DNA-binding transcriptional regulator YiaG
MPKPLNEPMDGAALDAAITKLGFNQSSFGRALSIAPRTVRSWVLGEYAVPIHIATLVRVMAKAKITPEQMP